MKNIALIDTNVLLDFLQSREPFYGSAKAIFSLCKNRKIDGYISASSILDTFYICRKDFSVQELREILLDLNEIIKIVSVDCELVIEALNDNMFDDFEDCVQSKCATSVGANYIITRNIKDFDNSFIKAISPSDFIRDMDA